MEIGRQLSVVLPRPGGVSSGERRERLARFRPHQFAVAIDASPVAIDEAHGFSANRTFRRRSLINNRQLRKFEIVFISHNDASPYSRGFIFSCNAFSALSRLGTPTNVSRPSIIVAGTARTEWRLARSSPSCVVISTSR